MKNEISFKENNLLAIRICFALFLSFIIKIFLVQTGLNDGDSITHYYISHHAFKHPVLFLHHWGKPFFTLLSAPFAYFGYNGIQIFNILCGCLSAYLSYRIALKLNIKYAFSAIIFTLLAPVYFIVLPTGLTEPLFSLVLIASVYLLVINKNIAAAVLISFLPFARTEGFLILPAFGLFFLLTKNYKAIPFLVAGTLIYSILGYFVYDDLGWVFSQNPYQSNNVYGHGKLTTFVDNIKGLTGIPVTFLWMIGLIYFTSIAYKALRKNALDKKYLIEVLLFACFVIYFVAHSVFWWKGLFGSLGMMRVIAGVVPVFAVGAARGFSFILSSVGNKFRGLKLALAAIILFIVIITPIQIYGLYEEMDPRLKIVQAACEHIKTQQIPANKVYYSHPLTVMCLDIDPFLEEQRRELRYQPHDLSGIKSGDYILWDSQFGPVESNKPLETFTNSGKFELVKTFKPAKGVKIPGNQKFEVLLFERK